MHCTRRGSEKSNSLAIFWGFLIFSQDWLFSRNSTRKPLNLKKSLTFRDERIEPKTFFSQTFRALPGYPGKIPAYPGKKVWFPGLRGTYRTFWPPPLHVEDPTPPENIRTQKFRFGFFFFAWFFTNAPCKPTCLYNAPSMHTVDVFLPEC